MAGYDYYFCAYQKDTGKLQFRRRMKRSRCRAKVKHGRCSRKVSLTYPYCSQHTKQLLRLQVAPSVTLQSIGITGENGLFAYAPWKKKKPVFRKYQRIVRYEGELLDSHDLDRRYYYKRRDRKRSVTAPYAMELLDDLVLDAALKRGVAAYANDAHGTPYRANADLVVDEDVHPPQAWLVARENIYHGQEILTRYGKDYFREDALVTTVERKR